MQTGWRYRIGCVLGVIGLSMLAVAIANQPLLQRLFTTHVPLFWRLEPTVLSGEALIFAMGLTAATLLACLIPLYKPRPRRILDIVALAHKRVSSRDRCWPRSASSSTPIGCCGRHS